MKKFYLSENDCWLGGVCGGLSEYFDIDVTIIRILMLIFSSWTITVYLLFWIFAPTNDTDKKSEEKKEEQTTDNEKTNDVESVIKNNKNEGQF